MKDINVTGKNQSAIADVSEYIKEGILVIPEGIEYILEEACHQREDLEEVYLPSSMKVIGPVAFAECPNLRRVVLNHGLEEIGDGAFLGAISLTDIDLPSTLKEIGSMAFYSCGIGEVSVPESVSHIGESCFWECMNLRKADVLNPQCLIDEDAFAECPNLTEGYMAPGFPKDDIPSSNLLFSILWLTSYERHAQSNVMVDGEERRDFSSLHVHMDEPKGRFTVGQRASAFIKGNAPVVLEQILKTNNTAAMRGIIDNDLFDKDIIEVGLAEAVKASLTELASLFLGAKGKVSAHSTFDEFEL